MTTRHFLRSELKRNVAMTFRLSRKEYKEIFLKAVEFLGNRHDMPLHGRKTSVFLMLFRRALETETKEHEVLAWQQREAEFVKLTREQEEMMLTLRYDLDKAMKENNRLKELLRSISLIIREP